MDSTPKNVKFHGVFGGCFVGFFSGLPKVDSLELSLTSVMFGLFTYEIQSQNYQGMGAHMDETQSKCLQEPLRNGSTVFT